MCLRNNGTINPKVISNFVLVIVMYDLRYLSLSLINIFFVSSFRKYEKFHYLSNYIISNFN